MCAGEVQTRDWRGPAPEEEPRWRGLGREARGGPGRPSVRGRGRRRVLKASTGRRAGEPRGQEADHTDRPH